MEWNVEMTAIYQWLLYEFLSREGWSITERQLVLASDFARVVYQSAANGSDPLSVTSRLANDGQILFFVRRGNDQADLIFHGRRQLENWKNSNLLHASSHA